MSKGDGGGVSIQFGAFGQNATGEPRPRLTRATNLDSHLTEKAERDRARKKSKGKLKSKKNKLTAEQRKAENDARKNFRSAPKDVAVEHRENGRTVATRTVKRS